MGINKIINKLIKTKEREKKNLQHKIETATDDIRRLCKQQLEREKFTPMYSTLHLEMEMETLRESKDKLKSNKKQQKLLKMLLEKTSNKDD